MTEEKKYLKEYAKKLDLEKCVEVFSKRAYVGQVMRIRDHINQAVTGLQELGLMDYRQDLLELTNSLKLDVIDPIVAELEKEYKEKKEQLAKEAEATKPEEKEVKNE